MMPAVEIAVLFLVVALVMGLLGLVALLVHRRAGRRAAERPQPEPQPEPPSTQAPPPAAAPAPPAAPPPASRPAATRPAEPAAPPPGKRARASTLPRPLPEQSRQRYLTAWSGVQHRFEDSPVLALSQADALLGALLAERGLPSDGMRTQADLPAGTGGRVLEEFRLGHLIEQSNSTRRADLAQVSVGMEHFRRVFEELVSEPGLPSSPAPRASTSGERDT